MIELASTGNANMGLHAEEPLCPLSLVDCIPGVALFGLVLRGIGRVDIGRFHDHAASNLDAVLAQEIVDGFKEFLAQVILFEKVPESAPSSGTAAFPRSIPTTARIESTS